MLSIIVSLAWVWKWWTVPRHLGLSRQRYQGNNTKCQNLTNFGDPWTPCNGTFSELVLFSQFKLILVLSTHRTPSKPIEPHQSPSKPIKIPSKPIETHQKPIKTRLKPDWNQIETRSKPDWNRIEIGSSEGEVVHFKSSDKFFLSMRGI